MALPPKLCYEIIEDNIFSDPGSWERICLNYLMLSELDLEDIKKDNESSSGQIEVRYQTLLTWKKRNGAKATERTLKEKFNQFKTTYQTEKNNLVLDSYLLNHSCKGKVLILNNLFQKTNHYREGSENDVKRLETLWNSMNFQVIIEENVDAENFVPVIESFKRNLVQSDISVTFFMSHGSNHNGESIFGNDCNLVKTDKIINLFNAKNLKALAGQPKLIFFQMCRGTKTSSGFDAATKPNRMEEKNDTVPPSSSTDAAAPCKDTSHENADMLVAKATQFNEMAYRNANGSWFISSMCDVFESHSHEYEIYDLMRIVTNQVSKKITNAPSQPNIHNKRSICEIYTSTLRKKLYLH